MSLVGILLLPFTFLYSAIIRLRNHLFNIGYTRSFSFGTFVVGVGNLSVGGSGKTPMVEYLIRLLRPETEVAMLSRGYRRKTRGIQFADRSSTSEDLGDEPYQIWSKYGPDSVVCVGEERALAIPTILQEHPKTGAVILDDAYQHRYVAPQLNILLTPYTSPFFRDHLLPSGRLREPRREARRAHIIVITKCPEDMKDQEYEQYDQAVRKYSSEDALIAFSSIRYASPVSVKGESEKLNTDKFLCFSGIADDRQFLAHVDGLGKRVGSYSFSDHHRYTLAKIQLLAKEAEEKEAILMTTEKDFARMAHLIPKLELSVPFYYIPIQMHFIQNGKAFDRMVLDAFSSTSNP